MIVHTVTRRRLFGAAALFSPLLRMGAAPPPDPMLAAIRLTRAADMAHRAADPVHAAISAVLAAEDALTDALSKLDERDAVQMRLADEAADASSHAMKALSEITPTTLEGLLALIRHYAADSALSDPHSLGTLALAHIARVIEPHPPP